MRSMPELTTPDVVKTSLPNLTVDKPSSTRDTASKPPAFPPFPTARLPEASPFRDHRLLERLQLARFGANIVDSRVAVGFAATVVLYTGNNYQKCEKFITLIEVFCRFLESRHCAGETRIIDVVKVLRGTPGWPFDLGDDEVTQAWKLLYLLIGFPVDIVPITMSCSTVEEQIRTIFPPAPSHATPLKFKTTLSDILRAGLRVRPATYFFEHLQIVQDGNDIEKRALRMEDWNKEIIGSTFALFGNKFYDKTASDLKLFVWGEPEELTTMRTLFQQYGSTPPKFLAQRAIDLENLIHSRRAFWPALRRDLGRQRKEQPFAFWGAILALFFGICTVIQTVASVWALVATVQGNNAQESQLVPNNAVNGMRILGSRWLSKILSFACAH
ncbi:hypothetical protein BD410DRAFT_825801 [Rickenella mellea]|uniref:Uncharacterized protein n=1 Tax=Rickenella mellea TaxID=50990 RepID=A0A4Y7QHG9_9AGAM|nr:hypothetical protein BD410DRAFT_825801 [Rickenella mellea]